MLKRIDLPYNKIGSFNRGDPFVTAFIHPYRLGESFMLTGGLKNVQEYIKKNGPKVYFGVFNYIAHGKTRYSHCVVEIDKRTGVSVYFRSPDHHERDDYKTVMRVFQDKQLVFQSFFNKIPSSFPRVLAKYLDLRS
jgi:hypothetical protein